MRRSVLSVIGLLAAAVLVACAPMRGERHGDDRPRMASMAHHDDRPRMGSMAHGLFKDRMKYLKCTHACELWVHVAATSGGGCIASVKETSSPASDNVDVVVVHGNGTKTFSFKIATSGFEFDGAGSNSGIKIENDATDFTDGATSPTLRTKILARNTDLYVYKYSVDTKRSGGAACTRFDPMMINRD
jgi:hypothetical protein